MIQKNTLNTISALIDQIHRENAYKNMGIEQLLDFQMKLSILCCTLAEELADNENDSHIATHERRMGIARKYLSKKAEKINDREMTDKYADMISQSESDDMYMREIESETIARKKELVLRQANILIQSITMRLSFLKKEASKNGTEDLLRETDKIFG